MNRGNRGGRPQFGFMPNRGRGGPPMMGGPPRGRGHRGFGPRGPPGGPPRWGMAFANMNKPPAGACVPPPGHQQWNQMGWNNGANGNNFQNDWDGGGGPPDGNFEEMGGGPPPMHQVSPDNIKDWLGRQHPNVVRDIMMHSKWLLDKMGFSEGEGPPPQAGGPQAGGPQAGGGGDFATDEVSNASWYAPQKPGNNQGPPAKRGRGHKGLGYSKPGMGQTASSQMQWTPDGWSAKDNSHKVTTTMKPLPKVQIVPPMSTTYPEASMDSDKLKMLENNVSMMTAELNKICKRFNIVIANLNKDDLSQHPEAAQEKLKIALTCVKNAEETLDDYKDFLKTEKYKEWHDQQVDNREAQVKKMIGDTPQGVPHVRPSAANNPDEDGDEDEDGDQEEADEEAE